LKAKHGDPYRDENYESYDSENGSEDSDGQLLTSKAETKFATLLGRIKNKDKTLFTETEGEYFNDSDFSESDKGQSKKSKKKADKKVTLKDVIREDVVRRIDGSEEASESGEDSE
jgi:protein KRI1